MLENGVRCSCGEGHATYGECLRAKSLGYVGTFPTRSNGAGRGDATGQKKWEAELKAYRDARSQGIQPAGTSRKAVERAVRLSDRAGNAYDAGTGTFGGEAA